MTFTELLRNVGLFGAAVICCLAALSIFSVAVMVNKYRRFRPDLVITQHSHEYFFIDGQP